MGGIADERDAADMPRSRQAEYFQRAEDDLGLRRDVVADLRDDSAVAGEQRHEIPVELFELSELTRSPFSDEEVHLRLRDRGEADLGGSAQEIVSAVHMLGPVREDAPYALAGVFRTRRVGKDLLPRSGVDPIGADDEVEAISSAVAENDLDTLGILLDRRDRDTQMHGDACVENLGRQDAVKNWPQDSAAAFDA